MKPSTASGKNDSYQTAPSAVNTFFHLSPDLFCTIDPEGTLTQINPAVVRMLGWKPSELIGRSWVELVHPEDLSIALSTLQHCHPQRPCYLINRFRQKNGSYKSLSWSLSQSVERVIYAVARPTEKSQINPDRAELLQQIEALTKERQSLYSLLDQLPIFLHIRSKNSVGFANQRFREIFGEPQNKSCFILQGEVTVSANCNDQQKATTTAKPACSLCPTCNVFATNNSQTWEWLDRRNGRTYEMYNYPFKDINGEIKVVEMGLDITPQQPHRLRSVLELISNEVYIFNALNFQFLYVNARVRRNLGYTQEEMLKMTAYEIKPGLSFASFRQMLMPLVSGEKDRLNFQAIHERKDGSIYPVEVHLQLLEEKGDRVFLAVIIDITERKQAEAELRAKEAQIQQKATELEQSLHQLQRTQMQLVQSEKMSSLGQLVAGVAHEINNPVNFIYGNLPHIDRYSHELLELVELYQKKYPITPEAIADKIEDIDLDFVIEDLPKTIQSIKLGANRIREIVLSLRNFSRHDEAEMKEVDIHTGLDSTIMILDSRIKPKPDYPEISIIKQYGDLPEIDCHPGELNQVFMNILANAIDALETHPAPRTITITTELADKDWGEGTEDAMGDRYAVIRIADNGPGIPEKARHRLFEPFFTTKPIGKGTGLGLSISYAIVVDRHGGKLHCISQPGQGTEFKIEIPIRPK